MKAYVSHLSQEGCSKKINRERNPHLTVAAPYSTYVVCLP